MQNSSVRPAAFGLPPPATVSNGAAPYPKSAHGDPLIPRQKASHRVRSTLPSTVRERRDRGSGLIARCDRVHECLGAGRSPRRHDEVPSAGRCTTPRCRPCGAGSCQSGCGGREGRVRREGLAGTSRMASRRLAWAGRRLDPGCPAQFREMQDSRTPKCRRCRVCTAEPPSGVKPDGC